MHINLVTALLVVVQLTKVWSSEMIVEGSKLDFIYWDSKDTQKNIKFGKELSIMDKWKKALPLKVITHGWMATDDDTDGVFKIRKAYTDKGGYNVITVDWSSYGKNINYIEPAKLTKKVGAVIAEFLEGLVKATRINPLNIHLIGHSLGAHVMGSCGIHFKSGKIGRITGLDPAGPSFQSFDIFDHHVLNKNDANFVDVIHTTHIIGMTRAIGHVDFYPNHGQVFQPGCDSPLPDKVDLDAGICSHGISYLFFAKSVTDEMYFMATKCDSWDHFKAKTCSNNMKIPMGHNANSSAIGEFYIETNERDVNAMNFFKKISIKASNYFTYFNNKIKGMKNTYNEKVKALKAFFKNTFVGGAKDLYKKITFSS